MPALERVTIDVDRLREPDPWFLRLPAIAQIRRDGLTVDAPVTVVVGENGSGKSTFVEALAGAWAAGLTAQVKHWAPAESAEDTELRYALRLAGERPRPQGGGFLRAESMHALFGHLDSEDVELRAFGGALNTRSHGEGFLAFLESRRTERGLFVLDEPEAALSFTSCLRLLAVIGDLTAAGSQVVLATHSPVLAAFPGAAIWEFGEHGLSRADWSELEMVQHWRAFLERPDGYLRYLFD